MTEDEKAVIVKLREYIDEYVTNSRELVTKLHCDTILTEMNYKDAKDLLGKTLTELESDANELGWRCLEMMAYMELEFKK